MTNEERRRRGARGVPSRSRASVLDANGAERSCLVAAVFRRQQDTALLAFLDLGPSRPGFDACRVRAIAALEARIEGALESGGDDPATFIEDARAAWRAWSGSGALLRRAHSLRGASAGLRGLLLIDPDDVAGVADRRLLRSCIGRDDPIALEEIAVPRDPGVRHRARRDEDPHAPNPADQVAAVRRDHVLNSAAD